MRIGIDANALENQAGTGVLARHLLLELRARNHDVIEFRHGLSSGIGPRRRRTVRWVNGMRQVFWTQVTLPLDAARRRVDVLLCPAYTGPLLSRAPLVLMVLDLTFLIEPQTGDHLYMAYLRRLVPLLVRRARRVVTISQSAAADLARLLPASAGKLEVAYPGPGEAAEPTAPADMALPPRYVLMVGTLEPRKNYVRAIEAFARFSRQGAPGWQLMIVGGRGWGDEAITAALEHLHARDAITLLGRVTHKTLAALYRQAGVLFYPSLYEGFGFPILEAMAAGCPVVTSNCSSMAEVGDGAVELVDPLDLDSMAAGLAAVLGDPAHRSELIRRGSARAAEFSWGRFADSVERTLTAAAGPLAR